MFFLQKLFDVPTGFEFILYKHGPFSFDLRDELTGMRADGFLKLIPQPPYGASHVTSESGQNLERQFAETVDGHRNFIEYVAKNLGSKKVAELEQLATALYVMRQEPHGSRETWAQLVNQLKPRVYLRSKVGSGHHRQGRSRDPVPVAESLIRHYFGPRLKEHEEAILCGVCALWEKARVAFVPERNYGILGA